MKTKMMGIGLGLLVAAFLVVNLAQSQSVPQLVNYQGRLTNASGQPINTIVPMHFALMDGDTYTATVLWGETQSSVSVNQGVYNVLLGSVKPIPGSALSGATVYLEVKVSGETLKPRQRITSVPFAIRSDNASKLGGQDAGQFYSKAEVDAKLAALQSQLDTHTTQISGLDTQVTANETDILDLQGNMTTAEAIISNHETRITNAETKLAPVTVSGTDFIFTGVNVYVRSGSGATDMGAI